MKKPILASLLASLVSVSAHASVALPSEVNLTVYEMWASTNADCTGLVKVIDNGASGRASNIVNGPDLGEGKIPPDGTYRCLAFVVDSRQSVKSATTQGTCRAGITFSENTCGAVTSGTLPDGTTSWNCSGAGGKKPAYFSTSGNDTQSGILSDISDTTNGPRKLTQAITVAGASTSVTFTYKSPNGLNTVNGGGTASDSGAGNCGSDGNDTIIVSQP